MNFGMTSFRMWCDGMTSYRMWRDLDIYTIHTVLILTLSTKVITTVFNIVIANFLAGHILYPVKNGRYWYKCLPLPSINLSGINLSGKSQYSGFLWRENKSISINVPTGITCPSNVKLYVTLRVISSDGYKRKHSQTNILRSRKPSNCKFSIEYIPLCFSCIISLRILYCHVVLSAKHFMT